jgi:D-lactate dehydrogenase (cytochrome)
MASPSFSSTLLKELRSIAGRGNVLTEPGQLIAFESDGLTAHRATPAAVVFVHDTAQLQRIVSTLYKAKFPFVPRGAGTGLSGGALADGKVVLQLSRLNRILWIDAENRRARVQPGVINTHLNEAAARHGLMYAPDPSSQTACTIGGNVAENAGGPHCLKYGVTTNHILGLSVVAPDGALLELTGPDGPDYDLVGLFVGSEGTLGVCTEIEVRLVPRPAAVETLLAHFEDINSASHAVSAIIAAGILPAALEMIDQNTLKAVEASVFAAGFPTDVAASLIVELDGPKAGLAEQAAAVELLLQEHRAREVARATSDAQRLKFWKARKSAFGAMGRIGSDLLVQDATVPRSRIPDVLDRVYEISRKYDLVVTNVFHAGDGNLHPNMPFDRRDEGATERVHEASREIMEACVAAGGTITGEHGVGIDKRKYMPLVYSDDDLQTMRWVKQVFDPSGLCNPGKLLPDGTAAKPVAASVRPAVAKSPAAAVESALGAECLLESPEEFVIDGKPAEVVAAPASIDELSELMKLASHARWGVVPAGRGRWLACGRPLQRADLVVSTQRLTAAVEHRPEDLLATAQAGTSLTDLNQALAGAGQWWPLDPLGGGTLGAAIATGSAGPLAAKFGVPRDLVLGLTAVLADGRVVKAGGRVVKNVAGYDMVKLFTGSFGTLGIIAQAHLRLYAVPQADETRVFSAADARALTKLAASLAESERLAPAAVEVLSPAAASAAELRGDEWRMAVRWMGHKAAVRDAVQAVSAMATISGAKIEAVNDVWPRITTIEERLTPVLSVRVVVPPRGTAELIRQGMLIESVEPPALVAAPGLGRAWIFADKSTYHLADVRRWARRIEELRRMAAEGGGNVRVESAPAELRRVVDSWGDPGRAARIGKGLKKQFDPNAILKPGFLQRGGSSDQL